MNCSDAVQRKLFDSHADAELKAALFDAIPVFKAPRNPRKWAAQIGRLRQQALARVILRGYPPAIVNGRSRVVWGEVLRPDPSYVIRKLRYEIYPQYWLPALLYEPTGLKGRVPVVLNPVGHFAMGKANADQQIRCANLARRGLLALNLEFIGMGELYSDVYHHRQAHLNLTGLTGVGMMYLALKKGLDVLLAHRHADRRRVAVTGLSGGGWQTIVISALDPRVTLSVPVAGHTSLRARINVPMDIGDLEQAPVDLTTVLDYQDMTAMLAPRPALLICNEHDDCCFASARAKPVIFDAVRPVYQAFGAADRFEFHSNFVPGTHNYGADNRHQLYRFLNRHFGLSTPTEDLHRPEEVLNEATLAVGLPVEQASLLSIARKRAYALGVQPRRPQTAAARTRLRVRLVEVLHLENFTATGPEVCQNGDHYQHRLRLGPWTVPVTGFTPPDAVATELRIAEQGRAGCGQPPVAGRNLFAADIFDTGENKYQDDLKMLLEAAGRRMLGIQVGQVLACAQWATRQTKVRRLHLTATGFTTGLAALLAAGLRPDLFESLSLTNHLVTLKSLVDWPEDYRGARQSLFCFGLLEVCDLPDLEGLLEHVTFFQPRRQ